jgi:predicted ATP-dependent serine protease
MTKYRFDCNNCGYSSVQDYIQGPCPNCGEGVFYNNTIIKNEPCFVATAAFGDYEAPEVIILRRFRDKKLSRYKIGRAFISVYYMVGPYMAKGISGKPRIKKFFRYLFCKLAAFLEKK